MILIGGMQKHQAIKTDGICTTLSASMGMGGGYVPMILEIYDMQIACEKSTNERLVDDGVTPTSNTYDKGETNRR